MRRAAAKGEKQVRKWSSLLVNYSAVQTVNFILVFESINLLSVTYTWLKIPVRITTTVLLQRAAGKTLLPCLLGFKKYISAGDEQEWEPYYWFSDYISPSSSSHSSLPPFLFLILIHLPSFTVGGKIGSVNSNSLSFQSWSSRWPTCLPNGGGGRRRCRIDAASAAVLYS